MHKPGDESVHKDDQTAISRLSVIDLMMAAAEEIAHDRTLRTEISRPECDVQFIITFIRARPIKTSLAPRHDQRIVGN